MNVGGRGAERGQLQKRGQRQARKPVPHSGLGHLLGVPGGGCNGVQQSQEAEASRGFLAA